MARLGQHLSILIALAGVVAALNVFKNLMNTALWNSAPIHCGGMSFTGTNFMGDTSCLGNLSARVGFTFVFGLIVGVLGWLASIGVYRAALRRTEGVTPSFDQLTTGENLGPYVVTALVYGLAMVATAASCFLLLPVVVFLFQFAPFYALDKGQQVGAAFGNSYRAVTSNFVPVLLAALVNIVAAAIGSSFWGLATLVTLPFSALFTAHIYRQLNNEAIAE